MGHAVFHVKTIDDLFGLRHELLGFGVSDFITTPFRAYFRHVNPRYHSVALIETGKQDLHHLMVERYSLDDAGQGYDSALGEPEKIMTILDRHPNDTAMSFYLKSPSGFMLEYGWGGRTITPGDRRPTEVTVGPSPWGHDRAWLPEDQREKCTGDEVAGGAGRQAGAGAGDRGQPRADGWCLSLMGRRQKAAIARSLTTPREKSFRARVGHATLTRINPGNRERGHEF